MADYLDVPITYANHPNWQTSDQFDVCVDAGAFKVGNGSALCTNRLKTAPFNAFLAANQPDGQECVIYYGFDNTEMGRVQRRIGVMAAMGYRTDYPLMFWKERTIHSTREIGIEPPNSYSLFKHANCTGCLKAGKQHWYLVFLHRPDVWAKAKWAEDCIGYSILKEQALAELEDTFAAMQELGITTTEHEDPRTFFARVARIFKKIDEDYASQ